MSELGSDTLALQEAFCAQRGLLFKPTDIDEIIGIASSTIGKLPSNGLRHLPERQTSGWYIWFGDELVPDANFFVPTHAKHFYESHPEFKRITWFAARISLFAYWRLFGRLVRRRIIENLR